jgi:hypothetical protein
MNPPPSYPFLIRRLRQRLQGQSRPGSPAAPGAETAAGEDPAHPTPLDDLIPGEVRERLEGACYRICRPARELYGDTTALVRRYRHLFQLPNLPPDFAALPRTFPERVLFLDIETTGLMAKPVFLIGLGSLMEEDLMITQLLARDYAEEVAILADFREQLSQYDALVTFNGKCFDVRYLCDRMGYHGLPTHIPHAHVDLLPPARRRWRGRWENCRLQTLEARVCGRTRTEDLPSAEIPQAYHDFVRTGNATLLARILSHNAQDLASLLELLVALAEPEGNRD